MDKLTSALPPVHPGEILREIVLPGLAISKVALAEHMKIGRRTLYDLLEEQSKVSPDMALRLAKVCGNTAEFWLSLQAQYDLRIAREELSAEIADIPTLKAAG